MTLRHFKIFVAVCDNMNMTASAESLFISQSAVSQAIAELEKHYNVRLFERLSRKLYITQAGEKLLSYARHIIKLNLEVEQSMKALHENSLIRLGASVTIGTSVLPKLISTYKQLMPSTVIEVFEDNTQQIERQILRDEIDIALIEGEITSPDINSILFMDDELVLICSVSHRFALCSIIEPQELEKENFIVREQGSGTRQTFENMMAKNHLKWKATWTCNNADTIKMAVAEGHGISIISKRSVVHEVNYGLLCMKPIRGIDFKRQFKIIFHKNKYLTLQMKEFIDVCVKS